MFFRAGVLEKNKYLSRETTAKNRQADLKSARIKTRHENHKNTVCKQFKKQQLCEAKQHRMFRDLVFCWPVGKKTIAHSSCFIFDGTVSFARWREINSPFAG